MRIRKWEEFCNAPSRYIDVRLRSGLRWLALRVSKRPFLFMFLPVLVSFCFGTGIYWLRSESSYYKLWYPTDTPQYRDLEKFWHTFGFDNRTEIIIIRAASGGVYDRKNGGSSYGILDRTALLDVLTIQEALASSEMPNERRGESQTVSYSTVCSRAWLQSNDGASAPCLVSSLLELWDSDRMQLETESQIGILAKLNNPNELTTSYGSALYLPSVVGDTVKDENDNERIVSAGALQLVFQVDEKYFDAAKQYDKARDFEAAFLAQAEKLSRDYSANFDLFYYTASSFQTESDQAIADDQKFVTYAMILMVLYVSVMLGRCDPVHSKVLLSLSIIATIMMSLLFAFGMSGYLGYPLTQLSLMSIFILLGVGVDDMFILVDAWDRTSSKSSFIALDDESLQNRLCKTYGEVGPSILLTSLTDFTAFMIGSTITVPAISGFCKVAGLSVLAVFAIQLTFFGAALVLDARRVRAGALDCFACIVWRKPRENVSSNERKGKVITEDPEEEKEVKMVLENEQTKKFKGDVNTTAKREAAHVEQKPSKKEQEARGMEKKSAIREFLGECMRTLSACVLRPRTAVAVVVVFLAIDLTLGIFAMKRVETGADWSDFLPADSYVLDFYDARDGAGFGSVGTINFATFKDIDVGNDDQLEGLKTMASTARALPFVVGLDSWYESLQQWVASPEGLNADATDGRAFAEYSPSERRRLLAAWAFSSSPAADTKGFGGTRYTQWPAIILRAAKTAEFDEDADDNGAFGENEQLVVSASRMVAISALSGISGGAVKKQIKHMHSARDGMKSINRHSVGAVAITQSYGWLVREENMLNYTRDTLIKTLCGVLLIALLFLEPWLAVVTVLSVALVNMALFGTMWWPWSISLNVSSFINLVLAIGFAVDYSAHVAEGFMIKGHLADAMTPQRRMDETLVELGGSVLNGGLSTLLGVLVMAFSKSAAFKTLFQMFLSMVVFGLAHGLVFLPCLIFLIALASSRFSKRKPSVEASSSTSRASPATEAGVLAEIGGGNEASL